MKTVSYTPAHPILFVFDFASENVEVPEYDPTRIASATTSVASVRTIADVDGDVTVTICSELPNGIVGHEVFKGEVEAPTRVIAAVTSENRKLVEQQVANTRPTIRIVVDDDEYPTRIWIEAR